MSRIKITSRSVDTSIHKRILSSTAPSNPLAGEIYYDTNMNLMMLFTGNAWVSVGDQTQYKIVNILVQAGGGSGQGSPYGGCGGGAGGQLVYTDKALIIGSSHTVIVGGGGSNSNGSNSYFGIGVAYGGGGLSHTDGGCGSGGAHTGESGQYGQSIQTDNDGAAGYGNDGGTNTYSNPYPCGSGGGTGSAGVNGGTGGSGRAWIDGVVRGGGGGMTNNNGATSGGGSGGGGAGSNGSNGVSGSINTGSGGGGAKNGSGGSGGSGIVIIAYSGSVAATGGTVTQAGMVYHTFTASGTFQINS